MKGVGSVGDFLSNSCRRFTKELADVPGRCYRAIPFFEKKNFPVFSDDYRRIVGLENGYGHPAKRKSENELVLARGFNDRNLHFKKIEKVKKGWLFGVAGQGGTGWAGSLGRKLNLLDSSRQMERVG